ncbi:uncharacterized protein SPAPADRAFT_57946 [Spathaspora passalidarum NRRL Y-27907]|uniref:Uncharacterized protein n=1 Tax=Spathaspora passalidarum (strain NRRL Y-27907 / 11-Y1) TaxID=619300 RepID=G3AF64_SPAPN|nr:uncharacterized protein SPAPADRAFT_57946 [Spathaspora passalidarum NRRL Y-27907]EGW34853.1 hypothetical protein SPAPADRAFT_57946 [Spathaspora passalidarum NRRL Y-27907]
MVTQHNVTPKIVEFVGPFLRAIQGFSYGSHIFYISLQIDIAKGTGTYSDFF